MAELLTIKTHTTSVFDFVGAGVVKRYEEKLSSPVIGNGTLISGGVKALAAYLIQGKGGRLGNIATLALGVDAGEDLAMGIENFLGGAGLGGTRESAAW